MCAFNNSENELFLETDITPALKSALRKIPLGNKRVLSKLLFRLENSFSDQVHLIYKHLSK